MAMQCQPMLRVLRRTKVQARVGLSRSTIYAQIAEGTFPKPISLGARAVGWLESDVQNWIKQRLAESRMEGQQ